MDSDDHILTHDRQRAGDSIFLGDAFQNFYAFTEPLIVAWMRPGDSLLDIGCGDGKLGLKLLREVPLRRLVGVDIREGAIQAARSCSGGIQTAAFLTQDGEDIEALRSLGEFDIVLSRTSLHHFRDPIAALNGFTSLLRTGGRLILIDIDRESACWELLGLPLTLVITWAFVARTIGLRQAWKAILDMKYPSNEWRQHRATDIRHRQAIGWYYYRCIRAKLQAAFPAAEIGRIASCLGLGGVHYMIYEKRNAA